MELYYSTPSTEKIKKFLIYLFFFGNIIGIFVLWWTKSAYYINSPDIGNFLIAVSRITGLLGEYFLLVMIIFIGRIRFIEKLWGFDKLNKLHRWTGYSILTLFLSHVILVTLGNAIAGGVSFISQLGDFLANKNGVLNAFEALVVFVFVILISISIVRKKLRYETWYFVHLLTYLAIGLAFTHQLNTGDLRNPAPLNY